MDTNNKKADGKKENEGILGQISDQAITSMMEENRVFLVPAEFAKKQP